MQLCRGACKLNVWFGDEIGLAAL
uniref:Uncharacterized protein n=1 Tax=Arundo donax TaxID=35708 RepID=A0A0A8XZ79_ARUDO